MFAVEGNIFRRLLSLYNGGRKKELYNYFCVSYLLCLEILLNNYYQLMIFKRWLNMNVNILEIDDCLPSTCCVTLGKLLTLSTENSNSIMLLKR